MQWIRDETRVQEQAPYGSNQHAVADALSEQTQRLKLVRDFHHDVTSSTRDTQVSSISVTCVCACVKQLVKFVCACVWQFALSLIL